MTNKLKWVYSFILFVGMSAGFSIVGASHASAISGAPSNFFPDVNPNGTRDVYAITQIVSANEANWQTKMKAQTSLASIYVPESLVGSTINLTIIHGCDGAGARDGNWWNGAGTNYNVTGSIVTKNSHEAPTCNNPGSLAANKNIPYSFTAQVTPQFVYDGMTRYYIHTFRASAYGPETGPFSLRYTNTFQLSTSTAGVYVGVSTIPTTCNIASFPRSCPATTLLPPSGYPAGRSYVYSSFYGSTNPNSMRVNMSPGCTGGRGELLIYDLDGNDVGLGQNLSMVISANPGGVLGSLNHNQIIASGGTNNGQMHLPIGSTLFTFAPNVSYSLSISGLSNQNAFQVLPHFIQAPASPGCGIPVNTPPVGTLILTCNAATGRVTIAATANDAQSDRVTLSGTIPASVTGNGVAVPITAGTVNAVAGGAQEALTGITPATFLGLRDAVSHSVTLTLRDDGGLTTNITDTYTCPASPATFDPSCDVGGTSPEPEEPYYPKISILRGGANTQQFTYSVSMSIAGNPATRTGTTTTNGTGTIVFKDSGDTSSGNVNFNGINNGVVFSTAGDYRVTFTLTFTPSVGSAISDDCEVTVRVQNKPYFKVVGGDIFSGGNNSVIRGFNKNGRTYRGASAVNDTSGKSGAGVQGVIASSTVIDGVASGIFQSLLPALKPLTFANNVNADTYGGNFGNVPYTLPSIDSTAISYIAGASTNGSFTYTGDLSYSNTNVANGTHFTLYVQGDLTIDNNIVYAGSGSYASISDIPHVKLIVLRNGANGGNVRINPNVSRIDAEIISAGTIDTCYTTAANKFTACNNNLVVHGSLTGSYISLNRLAGTLRASRATDGLFGGCAAPTNATLGYCNMPNIGELIVHTPESYLSIPGERPEVPQGNKYDSITALPPLF